MRFIPRTIHGFLDYTFGIFLAISPWVLGLPRGLPSQLALFLGLGGFVYSVLTNYELGLVKIIPFRIHLLIDFLSGLVLLAAPWLSGRQHGAEPLLAFGIFEIAAVLFTQPDARGPMPTLREP